MCNFRVGQKVVCVDDEPRKTDVVPVRKGQIYTVSGFSKHDAGVFLAEVKSPFEDYGFGFFSDRFRPIVTRKTDISLFKAMLSPHKQEQNA